MGKQFNLSISLKGDAFEDNPNAEIQRILRNLADSIDTDTPNFDIGIRRLFDVNGQRVGFATDGDVANVQKEF